MLLKSPYLRITEIRFIIVKLYFYFYIWILIKKILYTIKKNSSSTIDVRDEVKSCVLGTLTIIIQESLQCPIHLFEFIYAMYEIYSSMFLNPNRIIILYFFLEKN